MAHILQVYPRVQDGVCLGFMSSQIDESYRLKKTTYLKIHKIPILSHGFLVINPQFVICLRFIKYASRIAIKFSEVDPR